MAKKAKTTTVTDAPGVAAEETIIALKGFDQNLRCRGFQFEIGKTYEHNGPVIACESGFHACEHPLDVLGYYSPNESRYAAVTQSGELARHSVDTKIASARITIDAELKLPDLIACAIKYVFDRAKPEGKESHATGERGAASATGVRGAASATGESGAASATGESGAASATGLSGAASATGERGAAMASGHYGRVMGKQGCALFLVYRDPSNGEIKHAWAGIVGRDGIKEMTWYMLDANGKPVEIQP